MLGDGCKNIHGEKEEILRQYRRFAEPDVDIGATLAASGTGHIRLLDPCPCDVHVEKDEQDPKSHDTGVKLVIRSAQAVEKEMSVNLAEIKRSMSNTDTQR